MWEELLKDVAIIKWAVVCVAVSLWGMTVYFLLKALPSWWSSYNEKKKKFTLEQMKKDLAAAERSRRDRGKSKWY
tara:strand:- start:1186 stop:1410 length:225 start_codon:yes stop_codon:yes gene_type:complete